MEIVETVVKIHDSPENYQISDYWSVNYTRYTKHTLNGYRI
jgi:hypothetical protein